MRPENTSFQQAPGEAPLQTGGRTGGPGGVTGTEAEVEAEVSGAHPTPVGLGARGVLCINNSSSPHTAPRGRGRGHYYPTSRVGVGRTHMATPPDRVTQDPRRGPCFHPLFPGSSASGPVGCKTLGALRGWGCWGVRDGVSIWSWIRAALLPAIYQRALHWGEGTPKPSSAWMPRRPCSWAGASREPELDSCGARPRPRPRTLPHPDVHALGTHNSHRRGSRQQTGRGSLGRQRLI